MPRDLVYASPRSGVATKHTSNAIQRILLYAITEPSRRHAQSNVESEDLVEVMIEPHSCSALLDQQNFLCLDSLFQTQVLEIHDDGG
jgi:hypothetical protein